MMRYYEFKSVETKEKTREKCTGKIYEKKYYSTTEDGNRIVGKELLTNIDNYVYKMGKCYWYEDLNVELNTLSSYDVNSRNYHIVPDPYDEENKVTDKNRMMSIKREKILEVLNRVIDKDKYDVKKRRGTGNISNNITPDLEIWKFIDVETDKYVYSIMFNSMYVSDEYTIDCVNGRIQFWRMENKKNICINSGIDGVMYPESGKYEKRNGERIVYNGQQALDLSSSEDVIVTQFIKFLDEN